MTEPGAEPLDDVVAEQLQYYDERAAEYEAMLASSDRFSGHGDTVVQGMLRRLDALMPLGDVLELAAGTGWWTRQLARRARSVTAVDGAPAMLERNRRSVGDDRVRYVRADVFEWRPDRRYDLVFFSFWLSHVPPDRFEAFWDLVDRALAAGGHFYCLDTSWDADAVHATGPVVTRTLEDGRTFRIIKVLYDPDELRTRLAELGWEAEVEALDDEFYCAVGSRRFD